MISWRPAAEGHPYKSRVPYQRMIRALVDAYAEKQEGKG
jgi:hypothetical protein